MTFHLVKFVTKESENVLSITLTMDRVFNYSNVVQILQQGLVSPA